MSIGSAHIPPRLASSLVLTLLSARGLRSCQSRSSFRPKSHQVQPGRVVDFSRTAKCEGCKFRFENRSQTLHQHFCAWPLWTVGLIGRRTSASWERKTEACSPAKMDARFRPVVDSFAHYPDVTSGKLMSSYALKVNGKISPCSDESNSSRSFRRVKWMRL
jgi:hypothetical protein